MVVVVGNDDADKALDDDNDRGGGFFIFIFILGLLVFLSIIIFRFPNDLDRLIPGGDGLLFIFGLLGL